MFREFLHFIDITRGMSPQTTRTFGSRVFHFLSWAMTRREKVSMISLTDVDDYLETKRLAGCLPRMIASCCAAFRMFFRNAEIGGRNESKLAQLFTVLEGRASVDLVRFLSAQICTMFWGTT
jgi:site-specific recombinase XerD